MKWLGSYSRFAAPFLALATLGLAGPGSVLAEPSKPRRIVALAPSVAELAAELVGDDFSRIVGVSERSDYPPVLGKITSIGRMDRFNLEKVLALKPDLVLATRDGNSRDQVERLIEMGLKVVVVQSEGFESISASMIEVGIAMGQRELGEAMASRFREGLKRIRSRSEARKQRPSVLLQVGAEPLVVAGGGSFLHAGLEWIGATNVYGERKEQYPRPSIEDAVRRDPDQIVILAMGGSGEMAAAQQAWYKFPSLKSVRQKRVRVVATDGLVRPSLRLLEGLAILEKVVHGSTR